MSETLVGEERKMSENFQVYLDCGMARLMEIWEEIGLSKEALVQRSQVVIAHLKNLVDEMIKEEENTKSLLLKNIKLCQEELSKLCSELKLPQYELDQDFTVLQKERDLRIKVEQLQKEKILKLERLKSLSAIDQQLCTELCAIPYYIPTGTIPTEEQLVELDKHIIALEDERDKRLETFRSTKEQVIQLIDELDIQLASQFEQEVVLESESSFVLSPENMRNLKAFLDRLIKRQRENAEAADKLLGELQLLWEQLNISSEERSNFLADYQGIKQKTILAMREEVNRCKILKIQNAGIIISGLRKQLEHVWDKCYISNEQRKQFAPFFSDCLNEEMIVKHEEETRKMKSFYEQHRTLFDKVKHRNDVWNQYINFEKRASNPNRLFDKGWSLLQEEKERKKIMKELPRLENEVDEEITEWEKHTGKTFLIYGMKFSDYIKMQWDDYKTQKENEKQHRQQTKQKRTEEEMLYGSKPTIVTPSKRALISTTATIGSQRSASKVCKALPMGQRNAIPTSEMKQPFLDLNSEPSSDTFLLSQTLVGSSEIHRMEPETTIAPVEQYSEFEIMLNENVRSNTRSSVATRPPDF